MAYQFYFDGAEIPITPGSVKFNIDGNNKTYTLIDEGEINVLKLPKLQEITFDVLLPTQVYPFANNSETSPITWLDTFESYMQSKSPFQFVIVRTTDVGDTYHGTSIRCSFESYDVEENADSYGTDVNVSVTLKEYKEYGTKTVVIKAGMLANQREQDNAPVTPASVDTGKADNPVAMSKVYNNTSENAKNIASDNDYRDYGPGTPAGSENSAYWSKAKDDKSSAQKAASRDNSAYYSTKKDTSKVTVKPYSYYATKNGYEAYKASTRPKTTTKTNKVTSEELLERATAYMNATGHSYFTK